jgi:hypothetical protein
MKHPPDRGVRWRPFDSTGSRSKGSTRDLNMGTPGGMARLSRTANDRRGGPMAAT